MQTFFLIDVLADYYASVSMNPVLTQYKAQLIELFFM